MTGFSIERKSDCFFLPSQAWCLLRLSSCSQLARCLSPKTAVRVPYYGKHLHHRQTGLQSRRVHLGHHSGPTYCRPTERPAARPFGPACPGDTAQGAPATIVCLHGTALSLAERQWLRSGLTAHRQIFSDLKHRITRLVDRAKTTFYGSKITVSTTSNELFSVISRLMNKTKCAQIPSSVPVAQLPQTFSDFFCQNISTIRQNIDSCSSTAPPGFVDQLFFWTAAHPFQCCKRDCCRCSLKENGP